MNKELIRSPFIVVNRPERDGAYAFEALVLETIDNLAERKPFRFGELCLLAQDKGQTLKQYVADQLRPLLDGLADAAAGLPASPPEASA